MASSYEEGLNMIQKLAGESGLKAFKGVEAFSPDFAQILAKFAFGDIYARPALDLRQRELLTLSSLITLGAESQLEFHFNAALNVGIELQELIEVTIHCALYAGIPRALGALIVLQKIYEQRTQQDSSVT